MNVRSPSSQDQVLILQPDNPSNTTIVDSAAGEVVYKLHTEHELGMTITYIKDPQGRTVASWQWRDARSDLLTLAGGSQKPASSWLNESKIPFDK